MKVGIAGLGHLADFFLKDSNGKAHSLFSLSRRLKPTHTNIKQFKHNLGEDFPQNLDRDLDYLIIMYPPQDQLKEFIKKSNDFFSAKTIFIFISSTSVYLEGKVSETSSRDQVSFRKVNLIEIENYVLNLSRPHIIIRPAGLFDEIRSPITSLSKREVITGADKTINLVHTRDVARFLLFLISNNYHQGSFNLCIDDHPIKKDFYSKVLNNPSIKWESSSINNKKVMNGLSKEIGFKYLYPNSESLLQTLK